MKPTIKSSSFVQTYCHKCKTIQDTVEYVFSDGSKKYKCRECYKHAPYAYELYGKRVATFTPPKAENPIQYGRLVT